MKKTIFSCYILFLIVVLIALLVVILVGAAMLTFMVHWAFAFLYLLMPLIVAAICELGEFEANLDTWWRKRYR